MTRPLIVATRHPAPRCYLIAALLSACLVPGCGVVCRGPGCEDDWDLGELLVVRGASSARGELDAAEVASGSWRGTTAQGNGWVVAALGSTMWVGLPDVSAVAVVQDGTAAGALPDATLVRGDGSGYGSALAVTGDGTLWIGAPDHELAEGAVFLGDASDPVLRGSSPGDRLGDGLAPCGDVDGDGAQDLLVSVPWFAAPAGFPLAEADAVPRLAGAVVLVLSGQDGVVPREPWTAGRLWWGAAAGDALGAGMACDRDLDGDGVADLAVGAPYAGADDAGAAYVISGAALPDSGPIDAAAGQIVAGDPGSWLGTSLATLLPADSAVAHVVAGAPGASDGAGAVWIVGGFEQALLRRAEVAAGEAAGGSHVGRVVASGDRDGDGTEDLLVGAPDWKEGKNGYDAGRLFVWYGGAPWLGTLDLESADVELASDQPFARVGRGLLAHDLDGDGADELVLPTRTADLAGSR